MEPERHPVGGSPPQRVTYEAVIERILERAPDTRSLFLRLSPAAGFTFVPGQFISCLLPLGTESAVRPYSIASNPEEPQFLEICLNLVPGGLGSRYLFSLERGAVIRFTGPWGTFTLSQPPEAECIFIAEGTGIAPIRPMVYRALNATTSYPLRLHYAAQDATYVLYGDEFTRAAQEHSRFTFSPLVNVSLLDVIRTEYVARDTNRSRHFYICGVGSIVPQLRDLLRQSGYERRAVHYEKW